MKPFRAKQLFCVISVALVTSGLFWPSAVKAEKPLQYGLTAPSGDIKAGRQFPFGKKSQKPLIDPSLAKKIHQVSAKKDNQPASNAPVRFYGNTNPPKEDTDLAPRRATFPGKSHTLSQMDEESPSQLNVLYKIDKTATAHVAVNEQNIGSPTYAPIKKEEGLNAAGVYLNLDVKDNVQVKMGGEVRNHETVSNKEEDQSSTGASVGLQWNF